MEPEKESLFSLELVAEKLYLPHVTCRFPAIAFRLLDFPTILINHVEDELAERLKKKISLDPYFQVPNQFTELKDRDGNFLMKRGKSCLFKMSPRALKSHLSSIPLYVMIIDTFPEVPKLLGTSSIPLNTVMNSICSNIKKQGITVPSVHGDRGLFKIYSLMGKEIGYAVLGYRLLSLGPGLISHLPQTAFAQRESQKDKQTVPKQLNRHESVLQEMPSSSFMKRDEKLNNTRDMGSMTTVEKQDALIQTVEMQDKNIHVEITGQDNAKEEPAKEYKSHFTQTDKRRKHKQYILKNELVFDKDKDSDDDDLIINPNINRPPPLFYNSNCEPAVKIQRHFVADYDSIFEEDVSLESISDEEEKRKKDTFENSKPAGEVIQKQQHDQKSFEKQKKADNKSLLIVNRQPVEKHTPSVLFSLQNQSDNIYPILTALMNEVEQLKNQQFQTAVQQQKTQAQFIQQKSVKQQPPKFDLHKVSTKPQHPFKDRSIDQKENVQDIAEKEESKLSRKKTRKSHKKCTNQSQVVPKQKGWIRQTPGTDIKKSQLVFGLTHTQRLRLEKGNPEWLKSIEKEVAIAKAQKQRIQRTREVDTDIDDTGNLSDTYTEVRRLQAAEMERGEITSTDAEKFKQALKSGMDKSSVRADKYKDNPARKTRRRSKSPKHKNKQKDSKKEPKAIELALGHESEDTVKEKLTSVDPELVNIASPDINYSEKIDSMSDSLPSSRSQKSIEVHIPSAQMNYESDKTLDDDESESEEELGKSRKSHFPGFIDKDTSMPESIKGIPNKSLNVSEDIDDYHPLESTRYSKQDQSAAGESQFFKSTDDFDTKQFHSTDEPELQKLVSDNEHSDSFEVTPTVTEQSLTRSPSPLPAGLNTTTSLQSAKFQVLNPTASQQSPIPALRRSVVKLDTTTARPSPTDTPRSRTSQPSPSPRPRVRPREKKFDFKRESIHTESVSSYMPSDPDNVNISLLSDGSYSDDFHMSSEKDLSTASKRSTPELPKLKPSTKLGYTIH
ncbi:hypothetical protein CHS0354_038941 [Potamilus streckersoni]|uniref:Microtubule-associated protein 10 n=1 Tax=Potamilus streckersoni TaxID=2493646 RepID=A0AAE0S1N8_9BIVA|nr:hypothetical protein CHS0354_038941 [Potamilus streckersoni]